MANGGNRKNEERKESPFQPNKDRIYQYISNNPGCRLGRINKDLDLAMGDTQYHLGTLEKADLIKSRRIGVFRRYYTASIYGEKLESLFAILGQEVPRDITIFLMENPGASQAEIAIDVIAAIIAAVFVIWFLYTTGKWPRKSEIRKGFRQPY